MKNFKTARESRLSMTQLILPPILILVEKYSAFDRDSKFDHTKHIRLLKEENVKIEMK